MDTFTRRLLAQFTKITGLAAKSSAKTVLLSLEDVKTFVLEQMLPSDEVPPEPKASKPKAPAPKTRSTNSPERTPMEFAEGVNKILAAAKNGGENGVKIAGLIAASGYDQITTHKIVVKLVEEGTLAKKGAGPGMRYFIPKPFKRIPAFSVGPVPAPTLEELPIPASAPAMAPVPQAPQVLEELPVRIMAILENGGVMGYERRSIQELLGRQPEPGGVVMTALRELIQEKQVVMYKNGQRYFYRAAKLTDDQIRKNLASLLDPVNGSGARGIATLVGLPINRVSHILMQMDNVKSTRAGALTFWKPM